MRICAAAFISMTFVGVSRADIVVDQSNSAPFFSSISIDAGPIGQEFVPTLGSLEFVELYLHHFISGDGLSNIVATRIRSDSIAGDILATSQSVTVGDQFFGAEGAINFKFNSAVSLKPGNLYVIELVNQNGPGNITGLGFTQLPNYSNGRAIVNGSPVESLDFYFKEGVSTSSVPEPSAVILTFGVVAMSLHRARNCRLKPSAFWPLTITPDETV